MAHGAGGGEERVTGWVDDWWRLWLQAGTAPASHRGGPGRLAAEPTAPAHAGQGSASPRYCPTANQPAPLKVEPSLMVWSGPALTPMT